MAKRLIIMIMLTVASATALLGCNKSAENDVQNTKKVAIDTANDQAALAPANDVNSTQSTAIDWSKVASQEPAANTADYVYPFAIDSQNVKNYADYFKVDNTTAQHNLTISTASNEALSKVLDQLGSSYTSHEMTDGKDAKLIIHTTADMDASSYDYVLEEEFAKGLVLPIEIVPDGKKGDAKAHGEVAE